MNISVVLHLLSKWKWRRFVSAVLLFLIVSNPVVAWAGVSVDIQRGFFSYDHTDLAIGGAYPVAIARHYQSVKFNGQPTTYGLFGPGTHLGLYSLVATYNSGANEVFISLPTGEKSTFKLLSTGKYVNKNRSDSMQGLLLLNSGGTVGYTLKMENGSSMVFGASTTEGFHLSAIKDRFGYGTSLSWDTGSTYTVLRKVCDPFSRCIVFNYTCPPNSLTALVIYQAYISISGSVSSTVNYTYDSNGNLYTFRSAIDGVDVQALNSSGQITTRLASGLTVYNYTGNRMISIINPLGSFVSVAYNADNTGRVSSLRWPGTDKNTTADDILTYFQQYNNQTKVRDTRNDPNRERTVYFDPATQFINATYNSADQSSAEVYFDSSTGFAQYVVDENGVAQKNTFTTDTNSNLGISFDHLSSTQSLSYSSVTGTIPTAPIPPVPGISSMAAVPPTSFSFTQTFGQISQATDSNSNQTTFSYDQSTGNLSQVSTQLPSFAYFPLYNSYGNLTRSQDTKGRQVNYGYDSYQNLTSVKDATGITIQVNYDSLSRPKEAFNTNPSVSNDKIQVFYDSLNRVVKRTSPGNRNTYYFYDDASNLSALLAPNGVSTYYTYNSQNQVASRKEGSQPAEYFYYNDLGQMNKSVDRKGRDIVYAYDSKSRLNKITYSDGNSISYTYDKKNRIRSVVDTANSSANVSMSYELQDLNPQVLGPSVVTSGSDTLYYDYDYVGNLKSIRRKDPSKTTTNNNGIQGNYILLQYKYNKDNSLSEARLFHDKPDTGDLFASFTYNNASELVSASYSGQQVFRGACSGTGDYNGCTYSAADVTVANESFTYDPSKGDLTQFTYSMTILYGDSYFDFARQVSYTYDYSKKGYLSQRTETGPGTIPIASSQTYGYNEVGELTSTQTSVGTFSNTFDSAGNPTNVSVPDSAGNPTVVNPQYTPGTNRIRQFGNRAVVTDSNGNITSDGINSYTWDVRDQLVAINNDSVTFKYDGLGRRVSKTVNGVTTVYAYSGKQVIEEWRGGYNPLNNVSPGTIKRYLLTPALDSVLASRIEKVNSGSCGGACVKAESTTITDELFIKDALNGSVIAVIGNIYNDAVIKTSYGYSPFGQVTKSNSDSDNNLTFTGREDDGTGLYYYRARYYSPSLQRFISEDPILFNSGDTNLYRYTGNKPHVSSDPLGLKPLEAVLSIIQVGSAASAAAASAAASAAAAAASAAFFYPFAVLFLFFGLFGGGPSGPPPAPQFSFDPNAVDRAAGNFVNSPDVQRFALNTLAATELVGSAGLGALTLALDAEGIGLSATGIGAIVGVPSIALSTVTAGAAVSLGASALQTHALAATIEGGGETAPVRELYGRQGKSEFNGSEIKRIKKSMQESGFDTSKPIEIAEVEGRKIIIDGHHRARAAGAAGIKNVPIVRVLVSEQEASIYLQEAADAAENLGLSSRW